MKRSTATGSQGKIITAKERHEFERCRLLQGLRAGSLVKSDCICVKEVNERDARYWMKEVKEADCRGYLLLCEGAFV